MGGDVYVIEMFLDKEVIIVDLFVRVEVVFGFMDVVINNVGVFDKMLWEDVSGEDMWCLL